MNATRRWLLAGAISVGTVSLALVWWLSTAPPTTGTTDDSSGVDQSNQSDGEKAPGDPATAPRAAWQKVSSSGSAELVHVASDGSGFLLWDEHSPTGPAMLYVQTADVRATDVPAAEPPAAEPRAAEPHAAEARAAELSPAVLPLRRTPLTIDGWIMTVQVAETPFGPMLAPGSPGVLSPDGRYLAVARRGLWVADLQDGSVRRGGSEPEAPPPNQIKHQPWEWAANPRWSADGQWISFTSHRLDPEQPSLWRVPAAGGEEELVSRHVTDLAAVPSRRDLEAELPKGVRAFPPELWHEDRVLFLTRPDPFDEPSFLSVLDLAQDSLSHYTSSEPTRGRIWPLGWIDQNRILVRILPLEFHADPEAARSAPAGTWILDLTAYKPPTPSVPAHLRAARVSGPSRWEQRAGDGPVMGGEVSVLPSSVITLRYDQPLDPSWIRNEVQVEGPGSLDTDGAPLGLAIVRLDEAQMGDRVRVESPSFDFDLQIRVEELPVAKLEIQSGDGVWAPVQPENAWPQGPLDLRIRFSHPVDPEQILRELMSDKQPRLPPGAQVEWADGAVLIHLPDPPAVVRISLNGLTDARGFSFSAPRLPPVFLGPAPRLVAVQQGEDREITPVMPEVTAAQFADGTLHVTHYEDMGDYTLRARRRMLSLDLLQWQDGPDLLPDPLAQGLRMTDRHGERIAGMELVGRLGADGGYLYQGDLVVRDAGGKEVHRVQGFRSFWPFGSANLGRLTDDLAWDPDGTRIALSLSTDSQHSSLLLLDLDSGAVRELANGLNGGAILWSPDGRHIAVGTQVLAVNSGEVAAELPASLHLRWSPAGDQLLYNVHDWGEVQLLALATGRVNSLGHGLPVGWDQQGRPLVIRWEGSDDRYIYRGI